VSGHDFSRAARASIETVGLYSIFGIAVDRKHVLKWLFHQEKATFHGSQKVYVYSENALAPAAQFATVSENK
jgi:thermostable 8-oxoguanine DNA glycosylase